MSLSGAGVAAGGADTVAWPAGSETSGPVDSWGAAGKWRNWGLVRIMVEEVERGEGGSMR